MLCYILLLVVLLINACSFNNTAQFWLGLRSELTNMHRHTFILVAIWSHCFLVVKDFWIMSFPDSCVHGISSYTFHLFWYVYNSSSEPWFKLWCNNKIASKFQWWNWYLFPMASVKIFQDKLGSRYHFSRLPVNITGSNIFLILLL